MPVTFITGNKKKLEEFMEIMDKQMADKFDITNLPMDLNEL